MEKMADPLLKMSKVTSEVVSNQRAVRFGVQPYERSQGHSCMVRQSFKMDLKSRAVVADCFRGWGKATCELF